MVKVKALSFVGRNALGVTTRFDAETRVGVSYMIRRVSETRYILAASGVDSAGLADEFDGLQAAMAAAQEDFNRRILSSIEQE